MIKALKGISIIFVCVVRQCAHKKKINGFSLFFYLPFFLSAVVRDCVDFTIIEQSVYAYFLVPFFSRSFFTSKQLRVNRLSSKALHNLILWGRKENVIATKRRFTSWDGCVARFDAKELNDTSPTYVKQSQTKNKMNSTTQSGMECRRQRTTQFFVLLSMLLFGANRLVPHTHTHTLRELNNAWLRFLPYHISMNSSNRMWSKLANFDRAPNRIDFFGCCWSHTKYSRLLNFMQRLLLILLFALVLFCLTRFSSVNFSPGFLFRVDTTKKRCLNSNKCKIYNIQRFEIAMNSKESIFPGCEFNFNFISIKLEFNHCNVRQFIRVFFLTSVHTTQRLRFNLISETKRKNRNNCHS